MTIDEAIKNCEEEVERFEKVESYIIIHSECGAGRYVEEHRQLAEWLKELKVYKERIPSYEAGYNDAKREIALSGEYERAYERGKADAQTKRWTSVGEKMPQEREWIGTKQFGTTISDEVYVTFETPKGDRFTKHLSFQNGKLSVADQQTINAFYKGSVPIAWMPLPEPYKAESEE